MHKPMTTAEAAQELELTPHWVAHLARHRVIVPSMKLPGATGAYVFERSTVEAFKNEREAAK